MDRNTGCYLKVNEGDEPLVYSKEQITYMNENKKLDTCVNNNLLPFGTNCCDFRQEGDSRGVWNESNFLLKKNFSSIRRLRIFSIQTHFSFSKFWILTIKLLSIRTQISTIRITFTVLHGVNSTIYICRLFEAHWCWQEPHRQNQNRAL